MQTLNELVMCPNCASIKINWNTTKVTCIECLCEFRRDEEFIDFVCNRHLYDLEVKSLEVWGDDLHETALSVQPHFSQMQRLFPDIWQSSLVGNVLEIGCGTGTDALYMSKLNAAISYIAFDIGANVARLSKLLRNQKNIHIFRANALRIPLRNKSINMIYSFGVFHHTSNPAKCFEEAYRVMSEKATLFFYVYSAHENNIIKYSGIWFEKTLMKFFKLIPNTMHSPFLILLSMACLMLFSWPSQLLRIFGLREIAKKFPMHWGTTSASIIPDLKDRLLAPVNHRFRCQELKNLLLLANFREIHISRTSAGLFGYCLK